MNDNPILDNKYYNKKRLAAIIASIVEVLKGIKHLEKRNAECTYTSMVGDSLVNKKPALKDGIGANLPFGRFFCRKKSGFDF
jgi:hypothetical protein